MKYTSKRVVLDLLARMAESPDRKALIERMVENRELTESDVAEIFATEADRNAERLTDALRNNEVLNFIYHRFAAAPEYLARALVKARPDLFWNYAVAFRFVLRMRADLGPVFIPAWKGSVAESEYFPISGVDHLVAQSLRELDIELQTRQYLYYYARDPAVASELLAGARAEAGIYERGVLDEVEATFDRLLAMQFPGVVETFSGNLFPALHVRWWIDRVRSVPRVLNIGDTGTYKTSFGFVGLDHFGCRKVLVVCAANAKQNHLKEARQYFKDGEARAQMLRGQNDLPAFVAGFADCQFHIVGWPSLISPAVLGTLEALPFDAIFIDECQYGKSVVGAKPAARALAMLRLGEKPTLQRVLACSATPWENRPEELAAVATLIRPDLFKNPNHFANSGLPDTPRILREIFSQNVVDVDLQEVRDLPDISPKPWVDLFGAEPIVMNPDHRTIYETLREDDTVERIAAAKTTLLLKAAIHPALVRKAHAFPPELAKRFDDWQLSSKLVWLRKFLDKHLQNAKIAVGTGIFVSGITREKDAETPWIGGLLREWYGDDAVLVLDGDVAIGRHRDAIIRRWKEDPKAQILLASILACPDSINLTIPKSEDVEELWITALSCGWRPWKQFLGRFWREGQGVPVRYVIPVLQDTIDEDLLRFNREKWRVQGLFRARVPLTEEEWEFLSAKPGTVRIREFTRTAADNVIYIGNRMRGGGESAVTARFGELYGATTYAEAFAKSFLEDQHRSTSGNIATFQEKAIRVMLEARMLGAEHILDAGCGPLTLERKLELPVFGVDLNPFMIKLGSEHSVHQGKNARVGALSKMPAEWTGKFMLTVASLVLDWTSLQPGAGGVPERLHILRELVRVTHPHGHLWLTFTDPSMDEHFFDAWRQVFKSNGMSVQESLSGYVIATDGPHDFGFWSLMVSPAGRTLERAAIDDLRFYSEVGRMHRRGKSGKSIRRRGDRTSFPHQEFEVVSLDRSRPLRDIDAVERTLQEESIRWAGLISDGVKVDRSMRVTDASNRWKDMHWRTLTRLHELGVLTY